ncbi:MAG: hypothetical protein KKA97_00820, partial [Actinobacteria bacterium]|nr:hypothetical protein [Actinomycetota bacterium]
MSTDARTILRRIAASFGPSQTGSRWDGVRRDPVRLREFKRQRAVFVVPVPPVDPLPVRPVLSMTREVVEA